MGSDFVDLKGMEVSEMEELSRFDALGYRHVEPLPSSLKKQGRLSFVTLLRIQDGRRASAGVVSWATAEVEPNEVESLPAKRNAAWGES
jgi:hypothetical protein